RLQLLWRKPPLAHKVGTPKPKKDESPILGARCHSRMRVTAQQPALDGFVEPPELRGGVRRPARGARGADYPWLINHQVGDNMLARGGTGVPAWACGAKPGASSSMHALPGALSRAPSPYQPS